jgi:hypothetical protein
MGKGRRMEKSWNEGGFGEGVLGVSAKVDLELSECEQDRRQLLNHVAASRWDK